jgi:OmpA-OmpF porin, OOP family
MSRLALGLVFIASTAMADRISVTDTAIILREPIQFDSGKATIKQASFPELDEVTAAMTGDKHLALVEVGVHTDERGDDQYNLRMSQERADAIVKYLVDHGVDAARLSAKGYGETKPIDKRHDEAARARNRRTEMRIVKRT